MKSLVKALLISLLALALLSGSACSVLRTGAEEQRQAESLATLRAQFDQADQNRVVEAPDLGKEPEAYLRYALLHHPKVRASFQEWQGRVHDITVARSLPDPKLSLQADIDQMLMSLMPGFMFDIMAPSKIAAMTRESSAAAKAAQQAYAVAVMETAHELRKTWTELYWNRRFLHLREHQLEETDRALSQVSNDYITAPGMGGTLEAQNKLRSSRERILFERTSLEEQHRHLLLRLGAALGLSAGQPAKCEGEPSAWPETPLPPREALWGRLKGSNPQLASMRAMVEMASSQVSVAMSQGRPDLEAGLMADVKADPWMYRPSLSITLPLWRSKLRAQRSAAEARLAASEAKLDAELLGMSTELSLMLTMLSEAERMAAFIDTVEIPNLERSLHSAEASYRTGMGSLSMLSELRLMRLNMDLEKLSALRERDRSLGEIDLMLGTYNAKTLLPQNSR